MQRGKARGAAVSAARGAAPEDGQMTGPGLEVERGPGPGEPGNQEAAAGGTGSRGSRTSGDPGAGAGAGTRGGRETDSPRPGEDHRLGSESEESPGRGGGAEAGTRREEEHLPGDPLPGEKGAAVAPGEQAETAVGSAVETGRGGTSATAETVVIAGIVATIGEMMIAAAPADPPGASPLSVAEAAAGGLVLDPTETSAEIATVAAPGTMIAAADLLAMTTVTAAPRRGRDQLTMDRATGAVDPVPGPEMMIAAAADLLRPVMKSAAPRPVTDPPETSKMMAGPASRASVSSSSLNTFGARHGPRVRALSSDCCATCACLNTR